MKQEKQKLENKLKAQLYTPKQLKAGGIEVNEDGNKRSLYQGSFVSRMSNLMIY